MVAANNEVQTLVAGTSFCFCSVGMMLFNKIAIDAFPLECTLVAVQMVAAVLLIVVFAFRTLHVGSMKDFLRWCMVAPLFSGMLLTSILALKNAPMSLVVVLRCLSPLASLGIERLYPEPLAVSSGIVLSIIVMGLGGALYVSQMQIHSSQMQAIGWVCLNSMIAVTERCLQAYLLAQNPVDISKTGVTLINNAMGTVPLALAAYCSGEFHKVPAAYASLDSQEKLSILLSCVIGVGIGYTGIWIQSLISATSILVLINANKFAIIGIEAFILHSKELNHVQVSGAMLTIAGACLYGRARQVLQAENQEKKALLEAPADGKDV